MSAEDCKIGEEAIKKLFEREWPVLQSVGISKLKWYVGFGNFGDGGLETIITKAPKNIETFNLCIVLAIKGLMATAGLG